MRQAAGMGGLDAWYDHLEAGMLPGLVREEVNVKRVTKAEAQAFERDVNKAYTRDNTRVSTSSAAEVNGELQIMADTATDHPNRGPHTGVGLGGPDSADQEAAQRLPAHCGHERHPVEEYRYVHTAYKMVGVGSVGTRCYIMLMLGRDHSDPLFLQIKEAQASVLERFVGKSTYRHHGQRVVAMAAPDAGGKLDIFLGWIRIKGLDGVTRDYYVRQFQDWKGSADVDNMLVPGATLYARVCAATLARAHARWGERIAIASYLGKGDTFDQAIADFSAAYAGQVNDRDYEAFAAAVKSGTAHRPDRPLSALAQGPPAAP